MIQERMRRAARAVLKLTFLAIFAALAAETATAGLIDPVGDLLATYTGPTNGDLDVVFADFTYAPGLDTFVFTGSMAEAIGITQGAFYVWGVDRGKGTERFVGGTPSVGSGVIFDLVVITRPDTSVTVRDLISGATTNFGPGAATVSGKTITASITGSLMPSFGPGFLSKSEYTTNLWPRLAGGNNSISDFAPDASNFRARVVPEPSTALLVVAGAACPLALARRRGRG